MNSKKEFKTITPEIAQMMLLEYKYEFQRQVRESRVSYLAKEITHGRFLANTLFLCQNGEGKTYLLNGQHTLNAIVKSGVSLKLPVETFYVEDYTDIAKVYKRIAKQRNRKLMPKFDDSQKDDLPQRKAMSQKKKI